MGKRHRKVLKLIENPGKDRTKTGKDSNYPLQWMHPTLQARRKGTRCKKVQKGPDNMVWVEFKDGFRCLIPPKYLKKA